jgi:predicted transcriptional regulator YheO
MMDKTRALSKTDKLIIDSYKNTVDALASYLGEAFEIVLHQLDDLDHSLIKAANEFHSGRGEGAPITDLALSLLEDINKNQPETLCRDTGATPGPEEGQGARSMDGGAGGGLFRTYYSKSKYGKPVKSVTTVIYGEKGRAIGLLCINMYLDSPLSALLQSFAFSETKGYIQESYINDSEELICQTLEKTRGEVERNGAVLVSQKNKEIITILYYQGIFKLKNAVKIISEKLSISRNTVYLHIRALEDS